MIRKHPVLTVAFAGLSLLIAAVLVWRISLDSANNTRLQAISARGEPVTLAELDKFYNAVPEGSNAAIVWLEGVAALTPQLEDLPNEITLKRRTRLTEQQLQTATDALTANTNALKLFRRAANLSQSRYPIALNQMVFPDMQYLSDIKNAAQVLRVEAAVGVETTNAQLAADAVRCIFAAGKSLASEPLVISQLVRYAIDAIGIQTLEAAMDKVAFSESELAGLQAVLLKADDPEGIERGLIGERALFIAHLSDREGWVAANAAEANVEFQGSVAGNLLSPLINMTGFWQRELRFGIDALSTNIGFARLPDPQRFSSLTNSEAIADRAQRGYYILSALSLSSLSKAIGRDAQHRAWVRTALTAVGIERFRLANSGRLPENIAALTPGLLERIPVDPYDGKLVRYKQRENGYIVYCIGADEKDDGGTERIPTTPKGAPEDVTFIVEPP